MSGGIQIRRAGREDIIQMAIFLNNCWKSAYRHMISPDYLDTMSVIGRFRGLSKRFDDGVSVFTMMFDGEELIGAAIYGKSFTEEYEKDGEISAIYLHENYIGKGYGNRLFVHAEQDLSGMGFACFVLEVLTDNTRAIRFYLSHGYEQVADRSIRLGQTDYPLYVMRKKRTE